MNRFFAAAGATSAFIAVAAGAFAAHALKTRLDPDMLAAFETGARYQMYHALAIFIAAYVTRPGEENRFGRWAGCAFLVGTVLFAGSLYTLALTGHRVLGAITPFGGVAFLLGWLFLLLSFRRP